MTTDVARWPIKLLQEVVDLQRQGIDPRKCPTETFELFSFSAYDVLGAPAVALGGEIGSAKLLIEPGDCLVSKLNPRIPRVWIVPPSSGSRQICSTEFLALRLRSRDPQAAMVTAEFLAWFLFSPRFRNAVLGGELGSTGSRQRLKTADVLSAAVPVPPLEEQRRIIGRIDELARRIEEAKGLRRAARQEAEALLPAALREAFSDESMGRLRRLSDLLLETRYGTSKKCVESPKGIPVLRIPNVVSGRIELSGLKYAEIQGSELAALSLRPGDLLMVRTNGSRSLIGRTALVGQLECRYAFASYLIRLRVDNEKIYPPYLAVFLESPTARSQIEALAQTAAGQYNLSSTKVRSVEIPLPPLDEQRRIVAHMDAVRAKADELRRLQDETQRELDALLPSVLDRAFRGEF